MAESIIVNGTEYAVSVNGRMPLLWLLRDELGLTGTKYGCGIGACGSCNVLIKGVLARACMVRVEDVAAEVTTIEGAARTSVGRAMQSAWVMHQVAQCGYCQPGQIIAAMALLHDNPSPSETEIERGLSSTLCRCGTYASIKAAVALASSSIQSDLKDGPKR